MKKLKIHLIKDFEWKEVVFEPASCHEAFHQSSEDLEWVSLHKVTRTC